MCCFFPVCKCSCLILLLDTVEIHRNSYYKMVDYPFIILNDMTVYVKDTNMLLLRFIILWFTGWSPWDSVGDRKDCSARGPTQKDRATLISRKPSKESRFG